MAEQQPLAKKYPESEFGQTPVFDKFYIRKRGETKPFPFVEVVDHYLQLVKGGKKLSSEEQNNISEILAELRSKLGDKELSEDAIRSMRHVIRRAEVLLGEGFAQKANERAKNEKEAINKQKDPKDMSFEEVVKEIIETKQDPFISDSAREQMTDARKRSLLTEFKRFYFSGKGLTENSTDQEKREYSFQKVKIWVERQWIEGSTGQAAPAGNTDKVLINMVERELTRDDILKGVMWRKEFHGTPELMLEYAVNVVAKRSPKGKPGDPDYRPADPGYVKKLDYGTLSGDPEAYSNLKSHLEDLFVEGKGAETKLSGAVFQETPEAGRPPDRDYKRISAEAFDVIWKLYFSFDILSESLAKLQKYTCTRAHNTKLETDFTALSFPWHVMTHQAYRYGLGENSLQHLLVMAKRFPNNWLKEQGATDSPRAEEMNHKRDLLIKFFDAYFPMDEIISHQVEINDEPVFPSMRQFLTESLDASPGSPDREKQRIVLVDNFTVALGGWKNMLEMTIGEMESPLKIEKVTGDGGYYEKFFKNGVGLVKLVKGNHQKFIYPMSWNLIGRISAQFGSKEVYERKVLRDKLVESLENGVKSGLYKIGLEDLIKKLGKKIALPSVSKWADLPEVMVPYNQRRQEREAYLASWYEHEFKHKAPRRLRRLSPVGSGDWEARSKFRTLMKDRNKPLPSILSRKVDTNTSVKK